MQTIAKVIGSGKEISWEAGRLLLDGQPIPLEKILEYDGLGALEWASEQTRQWAVSLAATELGLARRPAPDGQPCAPPAPQAQAAGGPGVPADPWTADSPFQSESAPGTPAPRRPGRPDVVVAEALIELAVVVGLGLYLPDIPAKWYVLATGIAYLFLILLSLVPAMSSSRPARMALGTATGVLGAASLVILLPTAIQVGVWAGHPLPVRETGMLPTVERMIGVGRGDAKRMLDYPRDWREAVDGEDAFDFTLPDIASAETSSVTSGRVSLNASGQVETVSFLLSASSGEYVDLGEILSARLGYEGRLTGTTAVIDGGRVGVCRMVDASPTCSFRFLTRTSATDATAVRVHLTFARAFDGDRAAALSPDDLALPGGDRTAGEASGQAHRGETMYALIAESVETRSEAQARLADFKRASPELPWVVETSDHFGGMRPGWHVVMVAFRDSGTATGFSEDLQALGHSPYVKPVVKNCDDPISIRE